MDGLDTLEADVGTLARKVGYVYQDFENQIVRPTVLDDASYACLNYAMPDYLDRGREALAPVRAGGAGGRLYLAAFRRADPSAGAGRGCCPCSRRC